MNVRRLRMSFRRHVAPSLAIFASCVGCTRTTEAKVDEHLALQEHQAHQAVEHETETKQTGPETITTTVEEWAVAGGPTPAVVTGPASTLEQGPSAIVAPATSRFGPPGVVNSSAVLIKRTVTVDQRGPVVAIKVREAQETSSEDVGLDMTYKGSTTTKTSTWPPWWVFAGGGAVALVLAGWAAYKFTPLGKLVAVVRAAI